MTRTDKGNYSAKHPAGTTVDAAVAEAVSNAMTSGQIACKSAFSIAQWLNIAPVEVGKAVDLQEGRIRACQLGLFGYGDTDNRLQSSVTVPARLASAIEGALVEGRLSCIAAWGIADDLGLNRIDVARASEAMQIRVSHCQLGAF